jgi:hypothetical protein
VPEVPEYGGLRVSRQGFQVPQAGGLSPQQFGVGGEGEQTQRVVEAGQQEIRKVAQEELDYGLQVAVTEQLAALSGMETKLKAQLQNAKGKNAFAAADQALQDFDKFYGERDRAISNPLVKRAVKQKYQQYRDGLNSYAIPYANAEMRRFDDEQTMALIQNSQDAVAQDPMNEAAFGRSFRDQIDAIGAYVQRNGMSGEAHDRLRDAALSKTALLALSSMSSRGQDSAAKQFYQKRKDLFFGQDAISAARIVKEGSIRGLAHEAVEEVLAQGGTRKEMLELVRNSTTEDPDVAEYATGLLFRKLRENDAAEEADANAVFEQAYKHFEASPSAHPRESVSSDEWAMLSSRHKQALERTWTNANRPEDLQTDWRRHGALFSRGREALQKMSLSDVLTEARPYMSNTIYEKFYARWEDAHDPAKAQKFQSDFSRDEMYMRELARNGIGGIGMGDIQDLNKVLDKNPTKARAFGYFKESVDIKREAYHTQTGKDPDDAMTKKFASEVAFSWAQSIDGESTEWGPLPVEGKRKVADFIIDEERHKSFTMNIPEEQLSKFFNHMRKATAIPMHMEEPQFRRDYRVKIQMAYLAMRNGSSLEAAAKILESR